MDTILIVDDSAFIVEGLIAFLKKKYHPLAAHGGEECLEILKRESPSVVILDIMMEPMDGWETLARIKESPKTRHIPVLMFSAIKISPEEAGSHRISIDDCLTKPVSPNKIIEAIEKVLARRDTNRVVVERWQAAGISPEKIDEYLSLVTSLEVDLSLCQNMKIQSGLGTPKDKNQEEFAAVMKAIEERILQERDQIEALAREMNGILERGVATGEPAGAGSPLETDEPSERDEDKGSDSAPALSSESDPPEMPETGPEMAVLPDQASRDPGQPDNGATGSPPAGSPADNPGREPLPVTPGPEFPVSDVSPATSVAAPVPAPAEIPGAEAAVTEAVPSVPRPAGMVSGPPGQDAGQEGSAGEIRPGPAPVMPVTGPAETGARKVIPADPDIPPAGSGTTSPTGAGTDIPMPWDNPRDRKVQKDRPSAAERQGSLKAGTAPQSPGFFARIISLVRSVFGKRN
jgi:two-component system, OmpR family, response regulator